MSKREYRKPTTAVVELVGSGNVMLLSSGSAPEPGFIR
jgi:hypothetical protein